MIGIAGSLSGAPGTSAPVAFRPHVIDAKVPGGYAVAIADMNKDGKPDVFGVTQRVPELAWHESPSWERHVIADGVPAIVNLAVADLDADGIPDVAVENAFAMVPAKSEGLEWLLRHQGDPRQRWKEQRIDAATPRDAASGLLRALQRTRVGGGGSRDQATSAMKDGRR